MSGALAPAARGQAGVQLFHVLLDALAEGVEHVLQVFVLHVNDLVRLAVTGAARDYAHRRGLGAAVGDLVELGQVARGEATRSAGARVFDSAACSSVLSRACWSSCRCRSSTSLRRFATSCAAGTLPRASRAGKSGSSTRGPASCMSPSRSYELA